MNCKKYYILIALLFFFSIFANAQNNPVFDVPESDIVIVNSDVDFIIISNINDGDFSNQQLSIEANSSNELIVKVDSVSFKNEDKLAVIWVSEKGVLGKANITVSVSDADGTTSKTFELEVANYSNHGIKFEIHDAVFWQEVNPVNATPVFDSIVQSTNMTSVYNSLNWDEISLSVSAGCDNVALCDGHDFSTGFLKGYLAPEITGEYSFYINGDSDYALFLSSDASYENAAVIAANSDNYGKIGTQIDGRKSEPVLLEAGKVYAMYAVQWYVHNENGGVKWELANEFSRQYIGSENLYPEYDLIRPAKVQDVKVVSAGDKFMQLQWNKSTDNQKIDGYNIYLNGQIINEQAINNTRFLLENLNAETNYSLAITALDIVGNESFLSEIVNATTQGLDTIPPSAPSVLKVDEATGLALQISWTGANDNETGIFGYNVFIDGELYNTDSLVFSSSAILKVLQPETEYNIQIEAIDAGKNTSAKSEIFKVSTTAFNPLIENLGLKTGKLEFSTKAISFNEGLGINTDFKNGAIFNAAHTEMMTDFKPGAIRWGALTANPLSFKNYVGAGKNVTIGKFFNRCNTLDAFTVFCCGVENSTDWITNSETFIRFLEYINGPDETLGGQLRVAEGYTEPFLKNSKGLIFEFGNEVWGGNAHNAQIGENYNNYAKWCREMAAKMRASEYFDSTKIVLVYSSRNPSRESSYGLNDKIIDGDTGELDWTAPSGYLGGNLNYDPEFPAAKSELEYYKNVRERADGYLTGMVNSHKFEVEKTGRFMPQYLYESNTSTSTYNGRLGQALLSTDYYLTAMELGAVLPTLFHLTGGEWRITEPENNYRRLPLFLTAKYFNEFCKGDVLENTYFSNQMNASGPGAPFNKRPVGAHLYRNNQAYTIVLLSRDYQEDHFIQLNLPEDFEFLPKGKMYSITGEDFNTKYAIVDSSEVTIEDNMLLKVPKHGMVFLRIFAGSIQMENLPLGNFNYPKMEGMNIYAPKNTFTGANERLAFKATFSPSESWDKIVDWTLLNNSANYTFSTLSTICYVYSGNWVGNETDSLVLRASNRIGDVFDEVTIYLPEIPVNADFATQKQEFRIYPNPAKDKINIEIESRDKLQIFSINGEKVLEKELAFGKNEVNVNHLPSGFYTLFLGDKREVLMIQ